MDRRHLLAMGAILPFVDPGRLSAAEGRWCVALRPARVQPLRLDLARRVTAALGRPTTGLPALQALADVKTIGGFTVTATRRI
jgi:hypothetical protein